MAEENDRLELQKEMKKHEEIWECSKLSIWRGYGIYTGHKGLCILAAAKKKPFLADPKFLKYKGFEVCDEADNSYPDITLPEHIADAF